jgi:hypothetical protein
MGGILGASIYIGIGVFIGLVMAAIFGLGERGDTAALPADLPDAPDEHENVFQLFNPLD